MSRQTPSLRRTQYSRGCLLFSLGIWLFITICVVGDWDWTSPLTIFPYWCWAIVGGIAAFAALRLRCNCRHGLFLLGVWFVSVLSFSDNLISLLRLGSNPKVPPANVLRVVTLNCAGDPAAMREVASFKPDIILLQEIPSSTNLLSQFANELFGDEGMMIAGYDCAIIARGKLQRTRDDQPPQHVQAMLVLPSERRLAITSLRLIPPVARLDLWNRAAWRATIDNRRLRREQLLSLLEQSRAGSEAEILGGDFNTTANDGMFRLLSDFRDAHSTSGRGFGNTMLNSFPIARPDRVWVKKLKVISAQTFKTKHSDHRLVFAIVEVPTD